MKGDGCELNMRNDCSGPNSKWRRLKIVRRQRRLRRRKSASEANAINDYDDLEIAFTRGAGMMGDDMKVTEAWIEYPDGGTPPAAPTAVAKNQPEAFVMFVD